jgi:hypothetical protein
MSNLPITSLSPDAQIRKHEKACIFVVMFGIFEVIKRGDNRACCTAGFSILETITEVRSEKFGNNGRKKGRESMEGL